MTPWAEAWQGSLSMGLYPWDSPSKNTGMDCRVLLQGIFPTQRSNPVFAGGGFFATCGSVGKESACNVGDLSSVPGLGRFPWRRERLPTPMFWPGEFHEPYSSWGHKELDMTEQLSVFIILLDCLI